MGDGFDLRGIFGVLRRRLWLIVVACLLSVTAAAIALLLLTPVYTATTLILVDTSKKNLLDPQDQVAASVSDSFRIDSEVELLKSEATLLEAARRLDLAAAPQHGARFDWAQMLLDILGLAGPEPPDADLPHRYTLADMRDAVTVQRRGMTYVIAITARSARPELAALLANTVAETYIQQQVQAKVASTLASRSIVEARESEAGATVLLTERAFDDFVDDNLERISTATGRSDLAALHGEIGALARLRAALGARADLAEIDRVQRNWQGVAASLADGTLADLLAERDRLLRGLGRAQAGSDTAIGLRRELDRVEGDLDTAARAGIDALRSRMSEAQLQLTGLRGQLRSSILASELPPDILTGIYQLQQRAEIARSHYQTLLTRQRELDAQAFLQIADSRIVSEATPPALPSFPDPRLFLVLAACIGIAIGIGSALLIENVVGGFASQAQTEAILRLSVLSSIPRQRNLKPVDGESSSLADALVIAPLSIYSESIRRVRIGIDQALRRAARIGSGSQAVGAIVAVTSAEPNEGKTTISLALARAYAQAGQSTILIDCDLRKPSIHRQLGLEATEGLLDHLTASADGKLRSLATTIDASGAQIVLGSRRSDVATDQLIAGPAFTTLVEAARKRFDIVILDTPPIGPVVDGLHLAAIADAILFVVKWSATPQHEVRAAVAALLAAKREDTPLLAVLNQHNTNLAAYKARYAGYFAEV